MAGIKFWHVALTIIGLLVLISFFDGFKYKGDHIARVEFNDIIISDAYRHKMLMELAENESVKAVFGAHRKSRWRRQCFGRNLRGFKNHCGAKAGGCFDGRGRGIGWLYRCAGCG